MKGIITALVVGVAICGAIEPSKVEDLLKSLRQTDWMTYNEQISSKDSQTSLTRNASPASTANCKCAGSGCHCCSTMPGGKKNVDGCFYAKMEPETGMMQFKWHSNGKTMFEQEMDPNSCSDEPVCQPVPHTQGVSECCVTMHNTMNDDGSMTTCPHMELKMREETGATADIECLHYRDGEMNVGDRDDPSRPGMFTLKYKEPMKKVARYTVDNM